MENKNEKSLRHHVRGDASENDNTTLQDDRLMTPADAAGTETADMSAQINNAEAGEAADADFVTLEDVETPDFEKKPEETGRGSEAKPGEEKKPAETGRGSEAKPGEEKKTEETGRGSEAKPGEEEKTEETGSGSGAKLSRAERAAAKAEAKETKKKAKEDEKRRAREAKIQEKEDAKSRAREEKEKARADRQKAKEDDRARVKEAKEKERRNREKARGEKKAVRREKRAAFGKKFRRVLAIVLIAAAALAVACIAVYNHYRSYFAEHFYAGTTINGVDVSYRTADEVKDEIRRDVGKYTLTIVERDGSKETLSAADIGWAYVDDGKVEELLAGQNPAQWYRENSSGRSYSVAAGTTYDSDMVKNAVAALKCLNPENVVLPQDAIMVEQSDGTCAVQPETEGNEVDQDKLMAAVTAALDSAASKIDLTNPDCYVHPAVTRTDENLNTRVNAWNKYLGISLSYKFGDNTEVIDASVIRPYIVDNGESVELATDWIKNLVYQWGQKYDTFGLERQFTTHSGQEITIPSGGDYGWVIDKEKTIADVTEALESGTSGERDPIWLYKAMGWDNGDLTGTYVEVSLSEQHLWCYKDGVLAVDTDVVTGTLTADRATTPGCYAIDAKKSPAVLGTLDVQGYASPVSYWMPFNGGQGLHDAPWRSSFGGDIYTSNGSHGCVNMPVDAAKTVYETVSIGTAVVVYE